MAISNIGVMNLCDRPGLWLTLGTGVFVLTGVRSNVPNSRNWLMVAVRLMRSGNNI